MQQGINDVRLSIHQLIFCARNTSRIKSVTHKHIKFCSFKYYSAELFKETLTTINFFKYPNFNDAIEGYNNFLQKIMVAIDQVAPINHFMPLVSFDTP